MNTLAGCQFHIKNPRIAEEIINPKGVKVIPITINIKNIDPPISPSIPSIKFTKFTTAEINKIRNIISPKDKIKDWSNINLKFKFEYLINNPAVNNWKENLIKEDNSLKSSIKPTTDKGAQINGK